MDERDAMPAGTAARRLVDQSVSRLPTGVQGPIEIGYAVADVVDAGPVLREEPVDRGVRDEGCQQLDVHVAEREGNNFRPVGGFRMGGFEAQDVPVEGGGPRGHMK